MGWGRDFQGCGVVVRPVFGEFGKETWRKWSQRQISVDRPFLSPSVDHRLDHPPPISRENQEQLKYHLLLPLLQSKDEDHKEEEL